MNGQKLSEWVKSVPELEGKLTQNVAKALQNATGRVAKLEKLRKFQEILENPRQFQEMLDNSRIFSLATLATVMTALKSEVEDLLR